MKVEATKFTEVGYVGRDVDAIVRDLAEASYGLVLEEMKKKVEEKALALAEEELATLFAPRWPRCARADWIAFPWRCRWRRR